MRRLVNAYNIIGLIILSSCLSESDKVHRIYVKEKFTIEVVTKGDSGEYQTLIEIDRKNNKGFFEILSSENLIKAGPFILTPTKEKTIKEFLFKALVREHNNVCADYSSYKIGDFWNSLEFEDESCEMYNYIEQLIDEN